MKILYAIQGTGNGHLSRAKEVIPALLKRAQVEILVSGTQAEIKLEQNVNFYYKGLSFYFGKKGGIDFLKTFNNNNLLRVFNEIKKCPVENYDLVINDFEPISAWACKLRGVKCISLSHQGALYTKNVPKPLHTDFIGRFIIKNYAYSKYKYGFHFKKYNKNIYTPIIRKAIRLLNSTEKNHYTVYLPSFSDEKIIKSLSKIKGVKWKVFSKNANKCYQKNNVFVKPIDSEKFEKSLASCKGILCGAGFETPAEAIFLNKKLMIIPMKYQYEQHFNAAALAEIGVPVLKSLNKKNIPKIQQWVNSSEKVELEFPNETQQIIDHILYDYIESKEEVIVAKNSTTTSS
ncbi:glycosyltransferase family protein [Lutibacter sp. TH_r2]|uniref:glycosyltransferase family protein n=1 Tax=Lutibacter sp. TH_r2 TaxID=3082083 RepID=UPI0029543627|nr:glycosyltransferase family protein [Lutibacter sp. TH_r2]MDV7186842.1 glycosyltransferase family protein [Lutibacter sp. TH_r2]